MKKKLYKSSSKFDDQQRYKAIHEATLVSTPEGDTGNSSMDVVMSVNLKKPSKINLLSPLPSLLDVKSLEW